MDEDKVLMKETQKRITNAVSGYCFVSWAPYSKCYYVEWRGYRNSALYPLKYLAFFPKDEFDDGTADRVIFDIQTHSKLFL